MDGKATNSTARREARKKKILENASNRLVRITGRPDEQENDKSNCINNCSHFVR